MGMEFSPFFATPIQPKTQPRCSKHLTRCTSKCTRRRHPSPTGTDKPVGTWAPSDPIAMVGCPRTSHRPCLLMTTTANAHQSAAYDLMNVRTARTQHHRKKQRYKETLKGTHIKHTVPSALYAYSLHAYARQPSLVCAMYYAIVKMPNNFVTSPVLLRRLTFVY